MKYLFIERNKNDGRPEVVAELREPLLSWTGAKVNEIKKFLAEGKFLLLKGEKFDENNDEHRKLLPQIVHGDYFWVRAE